jgi:peptidoglycan/LPS O-acetylase OafA/YrhL
MPTDPPPGPQVTPPLGYHPSLDGLRAIAVASVLVFHASLWDDRLHWGGGWVGVDMFFVISGFLITRLLLAEFERHGRISLKHFYVRRALRLYPLIVVALVAALVLHLWLSPTSTLRPRGIGLVGIGFYFVNWVIVHQQSNRSMGIFSHLWTLSIEEQFYLLWPVILIGLLLAGVRRRGVMLVTGLGAVAVAGYRYRVEWDGARYGTNNPFAYGLRSHAHTTWYYSSFTHTDGLLIGSFLAALLSFRHVPSGRRVPLLVGVTAVVALVVDGAIAYRAGLQADPPWLAYWGLALFNVLVAVLVAHLLLTPKGRLPTVLALAPIVWIGRRSYCIYVVN